MSPKFDYSHSASDHLSQALLLRFLDDELEGGKRLCCESHLDGCETCWQALEGLRALSVTIEAAVQGMPVPAGDGIRQQIQSAIYKEPVLPQAEQPGRVLKRFAWAMAIAATLALGMLLAPKRELAPSQPSTSNFHSAPAPQVATLDVDGENFIPLPYSNPDLPLASHVVQMQIPVSSLADVGIAFEPVVGHTMRGDSGSEQAVLADVLIGADGQPRGIHVLTAE
jgi:hypothetical protein